MADARLFTYRLDANDTITAVNPDWLAFATENEAPQLVEPGVLGKPVWHCIAGAETQHLYEVILQKVRRTRMMVGFPYRCDAPRVRRFMEMIVQPHGRDGVEFVSRIVREEVREPVLLLSSKATRSDQLVKMCSWCRRIAAPEWVEVEEAVTRLRLFEQEVVPQITHCICRDCEAQARLALNSI